jgi:hypothetical protein
MLTRLSTINGIDPLPLKLGKKVVAQAAATVALDPTGPIHLWDCATIQDKSILRWTPPAEKMTPEIFEQQYLQQPEQPQVLADWWSPEIRTECEYEMFLYYENYYGHVSFGLFKECWKASRDLQLDPSILIIYLSHLRQNMAKGLSWMAYKAQRNQATMERHAIN